MSRLPAAWPSFIAALGLLIAGSAPVSTSAVAAPPEAPLARFEFTETKMGVPFKALLYAPDKATANRAAAAMFAKIDALNSILSDYDPASELSRLSDAAPTQQPVRVSEPLWIVLERSQKLAEQSGGAFDVTVGPFIKLWRRARRSKEMPSGEKLFEAAHAVGYRHMRLNPADHSVELLQAKMRLDLGGIAMGYAVDEGLKVLREHGVTRALIDASGDIGVGDPPPGEQGWKIAVMPLGKEDAHNRYVLLANAAISTAGDAFQHVEIAGRRYSHIVDPKTGLGLTDRTAVVVVAADCFTADSLDTTVSVLGPKAGLELIEKTPGAAALIVRVTDAEPEVYESARFKELKFVER